jgi:polar amino acid transport system substrate-binding protein
VTRFYRVLALVALILLQPVTSWAKDIIRVGGYLFPPYVETIGGVTQGLTLDLITLLNQSQDKVEFQFVSTSARRRYSDLADGRFDAMFFEEPGWGWAAKDMPVEFSRVFLNGGELYIALAKPDRSDSFFHDLSHKSIVAMLGYHYGFANFENDPDRIKQRFNIALVNDNRSCIEMVLAGRTDVAVVTEAYLWRYLAQSPQSESRLLISSRKDQIYSHRILLRRNLGKLTIETVNQWLDALDRDGRLADLWAKSNIGYQKRP